MLMPSLLEAFPDCQRKSSDLCQDFGHQMVVRRSLGVEPCLVLVALDRGLDCVEEDALDVRR